jgi:hypothetical protein
MNDPDLKGYSRISALEFVLVIILANDLAMRSLENSERFKAHLLSRAPALPSPSEPIDAEIVQAMATMMRHDIERFVRKVSAREAEIRKVLAHRADSAIELSERPPPLVAVAQVAKSDLGDSHW